MPRKKRSSYSLYTENFSLEALEQIAPNLGDLCIPAVPAPTPPIQKCPQEVLQKMVTFCHHISLIDLKQTNRAFRDIGIKEMERRIHTLDLKEMPRIRSACAISNIWIALTSGTSCQLCSDCAPLASCEYKKHPLIGCLVCKACFMEHIHSKMPKCSTSYTPLPSYQPMHRNTTTSVNAANGDSMIIRGQYNLPSLWKQTFNGQGPQARVQAYFQLLEALWADAT